jgi:hypothetical protein
LILLVSALIGSALLRVGAAVAEPQSEWAKTVDREAPGLPDDPVWGRGMPMLRPTAANPIFATGDGCAMCHSASPDASALWSATGEDASPHGLWQGTMMANAARDPYWRAQLAAESANEPARAAEFEALCMRCHTPMAHHTHAIAGWEPLRVEEAASDPLYSDGVSCTVCHQIQPDNLGAYASQNGTPLIKPGRVIFGPFADPAGEPMQMHSAFTPTQGMHIRSSALCGSCHNLETGHTGGDGVFPEQSPYAEWRNSHFSTEARSPGPMATGCIGCHMPALGPMRIARNPRGLDFNIETRDGVRGHSFVGANAFMLDLLRENSSELGVTASAASLERNARATRALLSHRTATVEIGEPTREQTGDRQTLVFGVTVTNLSGHKLPTGYPSRRVWIEALVRDGATPIFDSGDFDARGRLIGVDDELAIPHYDVITAPDQVAVYEMIAADTRGRATTILTRMAERTKDNRLLPAGWSPSGPHADITAPVGVGGDDDFVGGSDTVTYRVPLPEGTGDRCTIIVWVWLQTIPPAWADGLRTVESAETERFLRMYDNASPTPERLALRVRLEGS